MFLLFIRWWEICVQMFQNVWFVYNHQRFQISPKNDWKGLKHISFCPCERRATDLRIWASGVSPNSHVNRENDDKRADWKVFPLNSQTRSCQRDIVKRFRDHSRFPQSWDSHGRSFTRVFPLVCARFHVLVAIEHHWVAQYVHVKLQIHEVQAKWIVDVATKRMLRVVCMRPRARARVYVCVFGQVCVCVFVCVCLWDLGRVITRVFTPRKMAYGRLVKYDNSQVDRARPGPVWPQLETCICFDFLPLRGLCACSMLQSRGFHVQPQHIPITVWQSTKFEFSRVATFRFEIMFISQEL